MCPVAILFQSYGYIAAPLPTCATLPHALHAPYHHTSQLHALHHCMPYSCMATSPPSCSHTLHCHMPCHCLHTSPPSQPHTLQHCTPHSCASMLLPPLQPHISLPPLWLCMPHHPAPHCCIGHITLHLIIALAISPPLQLHMSHHCMLHCCMGHVAPLIAAYIVSPCASQLCVHIGASLAATHITSPCASQLCGHITASHVAAPF